MRIGVWANDMQWMEINQGMIEVDCIRINSVENVPVNVDACFLLKDEVRAYFNITSKPIFINAVNFTLKEINAPPNFVGINGWNSFLGRKIWEVSGEINETIREVCAAMGKEIISVPDEPGLVSARIIAMIINEAYLALEDNISTRDEMDVAMKLGTNYPYGPFEWAAIIGEERIFDLLQKLSERDERYLPATILKASIN